MRLRTVSAAHICSEHQAHDMYVVDTTTFVTRFVHNTWYRTIQGTGRHHTRTEKIRNRWRSPKGGWARPKIVGPASRTSLIRRDPRLCLLIPTSRPYVHPSVDTLFNVRLNVKLLPELGVAATSSFVQLWKNSYVFSHWTIKLCWFVQ